MDTSDSGHIWFERPLHRPRVEIGEPQIIQFAGQDIVLFTKRITTKGFLPRIMIFGCNPGFAQTFAEQLAEPSDDMFFVERDQVELIGHVSLESPGLIGSRYINFLFLGLLGITGPALNSIKRELGRLPSRHPLFAQIRGSCTALLNEVEDLGEISVPIVFENQDSQRGIPLKALRLIFPPKDGYHIKREDEVSYLITRVKRPSLPEPTLSLSWLGES